ncbi:elongation factor P--(R)-beta-lysine ligase [Thorsellia anophelis]|nr:elongation factor P--(R)-beta-lysine ligase [Thorsellia anophelis]
MSEQNINWQPTATNTILVKRAELMHKVRQFFVSRGILEVETPSLSQSAVTDKHLHSFKTHFLAPNSSKEEPLYLITSPEYHMKRMVASGSGAIFQICKCFRNEEAGRLHNPEFTMLEWYRPFYTMLNLINEVDDLLQYILETQPSEHLSYRHAMQLHLQIDPLDSTLSTLQNKAHKLGWDGALLEQDRDTLLQFLFSIGVEPKIGQERPIVIYHFPASQAALAKLSDVDHRVAERFEFYYKGIELANGFHELTCPIEQRKRFELDNIQRQKSNLELMPIDEFLLAALVHGMPPTSGVALGLDRLFMLALNKTSIKEVLAYPVELS